MSATARHRAAGRPPSPEPGTAPPPAAPPPPIASSPPPIVSPRHVRVRVEGIVQGVGFRPHVHRLARELGLGGWVRNDERGVLVDAEGAPPAIAAFLDRLAREAPPLARVEALRTAELSPRAPALTPRSPQSAAAPDASAPAFAIVPSTRAGAAAVPVTPDGAVCEACLAEVLDPGDRRHRYPFATCTNCGPRYTIVREVPYDRARTTMAAFPLCPACRAEYGDPTDRRFHAEPIACPACGPSARLLDRRGEPAGGAFPGEDAVAQAAAALRAGRIVAVKGLGGYHLACRADDEAAVVALRARKRREDKPFALMAPDLDTARALVRLSPADEALIACPLRPIVLAPRRDPHDRAVARSVAPRCADLGLMLPSTPLHHLLLRDAACGALVMTSGNRSEEPIAHRDDDALARLGAIADLFLVHDRPIHVRTDDSILRTRPPTATGADRPPVWIRRSRGAVPSVTRLPVAARRPLLAIGGELKAACCVAEGTRAWVGQHIGDVGSWEALAALRASAEHLQRLFDVAPALVVHDAHPDYRATAEAQRIAAERELDRLPVWHHHAHLAATLAEHGVTEPAVGAIFDGAGLGPDGTVWGGELLVGDLTAFARVGHLWAVGLPGGDRAAREPWRMAAAWLAAAGAGAPAPPPALRASVERRTWQAVLALADAPATVTTTSVGRLFDAVAALAGLRAVATHEGQAAAALEAAASAAVDAAGAGEPAAMPPPYPLPLAGDGLLRLDARPTILAVVHDAARGVPASRIAARFHRALARATAEACARAAHARDLATVVLGGGVWQNRLLLDLTTADLLARGLTVLVPERLPPGDGGLAYGQAAVAAATDRRE